MLRQLTVCNIAIVAQLEVSFQPGLTVITGESGSGKSILVDAIALAFGAKASPREILRAGCDRGLVELLFDASDRLGHPNFSQLLADAGVALEPGETEILISREFTPAGSRCRLNGVPVARETLALLRPWVVDLHGQHELTSLFQSERQRAYLDSMGDEAFQRLKRETAQAYQAWHTLALRRDRLAANRQDFLQRRDFLRFQLEELSAARLEDAEEDQRLQQERDVLRHADKLLQAASHAAGMLGEGDGQVPALLDQLSRVAKKLSEGAPYDVRLARLLETVEGARTELQAVNLELGAYAEGVDIRPERLSEVTERLDALEKLKRKYGPALADVLDTYVRLQADLQAMALDETDLETLDAQVAEAEATLDGACRQLSEQRRALALQLTDRLLEELRQLALPAVQFQVAFETGPYGPEGHDAVTFLFSANPGEPLRPLAKVASGGELSRFLLAMKVLLAQADGIQTLVFDEIDSGVSGPTARAVGEKLVGLARAHQVLVITHQPLIAALGQDHWHVEKTVVGTGTQETVSVQAQRLLHETRRLSILSRLVSGTDTSDETVERFIRRLLDEARAIHAAAPQPEPGGQASAPAR